MKLGIIFNNDALNNDFNSGWGFSCLINNQVLFDAGEKFEYIFNNMERMGINAVDIESVVISHEHWDHTGGLWDLLNKKRGIKVYACPGFSSKFKDKVKEFQGEVIETEKFSKVNDNIFVTGEIVGRYKNDYIVEQALVVKTNKGLTVMVGCSHPGILQIIDKVAERFPEDKINMVLGGFHLIDKDKSEVAIIVEKLKNMGVEKIGPAHCTGHNAQMIFQEAYGNKFISIKGGQIFEV